MIGYQDHARMHQDAPGCVGPDRAGKLAPFREFSLRGEPAFLLGSGPSLGDLVDIHKLDDMFTIGINAIHRKDNFDPTILLWQDMEFWRTYHADITSMKAIKYSRMESDPFRIAYRYRLGPGTFRLSLNAERLYGWGNSGALAFELAYLLGCDPIVLCGYDCCYRGAQQDFYGKNKYHNIASMKNCRGALVWMERCQASRRIIDCSADDVFPKETRMKFADVVKEFKTFRRDRSWYAKKLIPG